MGGGNGRLVSVHFYVSNYRGVTEKASWFASMHLLVNSFKSKYAKLGERSKRILSNLSVKSWMLFSSLCLLGII